MVARPVWQGHLKLSLVTCPVSLYGAVSSQSDTAFHLINPATGNRIRMITTDPDSGPISRAELVRGFEVAKDEYVLFEDSDFASLKLESTGTIAIEQFVEAATIDRLYWETPHYVVPEKGVGLDAFAVIRDAMASQDRIALGRVVLRGKEQRLALEVHGKGLVAYTLRAAAEVRPAEDFFDTLPTVQADPDMVDIASRIIAQKQAAFDPTQFVDHYAEAVHAMVEAKRQGRKPVAPKIAEDTNVIDLMQALRQSLAAPAAATPKAAAATAKPETAKPPRRRKAG